MLPSCLSLIILVVVPLVIAWVILVLPDDIVIVRTPTCGKIVGSITKASGRNIYQFYDIPYALPPIGERRFKPPERLSGGNCFDGTLDARNENAIACPQPHMPTIKKSEDCLVLTVISPNVGDISSDDPLPVVFWIHGGGLVSGANSLPGYTFTATDADALDAVVVNVNYRLGYLGFLQLEELWDQDSPYGNYGIQDIIAALHWVHENIAAFGGDPNSVTIVGESAGATAGLALLSSPLANNLFHRCLLLSPRSEMRFSYEEGAARHRTVDKVIEKFGCDKSENVAECLRNSVLSDEMLATYADVSNVGYWQFPLRSGEMMETMGMIFTDPVTIPLPPLQLKLSIHKPNKKIKVITSTTEYENTFNRVKNRAIKISTFEELFDLIKKFLYKLSYTKAEATSFIQDMMKIYEYVEDPQYLYELLISDIRANCPINELTLAMSQSEHHDVYRMLIGASMESYPYYEAYHTWDTDALFDFVSLKSRREYSPGPRDIQLRNTLRSLIKSFARDNLTVENWNTFPMSRNASFSESTS